MKSLKKFLIDIIPVVFGVLIALFIGSLKQSYDDQRFLDNMYATIAREMETNKEAISEVLTNHYAFIDSINSYLDKEVSIADILQKMNLEKANIKNTGYHFLVNSKLDLVDFQTISTLSNLDENKNDLNLKFNQLRSFIVLNLNSYDRDHKETILLLTIDVINSEELIGYLKPISRMVR